MPIYHLRLCWEPGLARREVKEVNMGGFMKFCVATMILYCFVVVIGVLYYQGKGNTPDVALVAVLMAPALAELGICGMIKKSKVEQGDTDRQEDRAPNTSTAEMLTALQEAAVGIAGARKEFSGVAKILKELTRPPK